MNMNKLSVIAGTILIAMVCAIAVMVTSERQDDTLVLESRGNDELKMEKASAESELSKLDSLKAVIQTAVKDPTDANMALAMNAQKELQGLMTHSATAKSAPATVQVQAVQPVAAIESTKDISTESSDDLKKTKADALSGMAKLDSLKAIIHKGATPDATPEEQQAAMAAAQQMQGLLTHKSAKHAPAPVAMAPVQAIAPAKPVLTGHESNKDLRKDKETEQASIDKLSNLKAIIHKAMAPDATPEEQQAAMAAAQQMQGLMGTKASDPVAPVQPTQAVETSQPANNKNLEKKKKAEEGELHKLSSLKAIIHHAMSHPDEAGAMDKAKDAAAKLQGLMTHQASPMPDTPAVQPLDEPEVSAEPQQLTETEPIPESAPMKVKHNQLKGGSKNQIGDLKTLLEKAKAEPTQANMDALMALQAKINSEKAKKSDGPEVVTGAAAEEEVETVTPVEKAVAFNLDIDGLGSIPVHEGDKADALAKAFAEAHSLKSEMQTKLQAMIEQQMAANGL